MKSKVLVLLLLSLLLVAGCQNQPVSDGNGKPIATSGTAGTDAGNTQTDSGKDKLPAAVPDELKTEAYHWYGLGNFKPMKIVIEISGQPSKSGEQVVRLTDVKDGKATFEIDRPGDLGTETISLEKDGVYTVGSTLIQGKTRNLEMPANVPPGATWKNTGKVQMTQELDQNLSIEVVGIADVDTKAGKQSALHIKQTGTLKFNGTTYRMDSDLYYVKDKGLVKSVAMMRDLAKPNSKAQIITIQETK
jgi:hypothetical protein